MSKGSRQRPLSIPQKEFDKNWDNIFSKNKKTNDQTELTQKKNEQKSN